MKVAFFLSYVLRLACANDSDWHHHHHSHQPSAAPAPSEEEAAQHAHSAATVAQDAANVANRVAEHSKTITGHAQKALKHALGALHDARVDTTGLSHNQRHSLKKAEAKLREATKKADYGELKTLKDAKNDQKERMQAQLESSKSAESEEQELKAQIEDLRKMLRGKAGDNKDLFRALDELEADLEESDASSHDEIKAELERLRGVIQKLDDKGAQRTLKSEHVVNSLDGNSTRAQQQEHATPVEEKGIDIDTQMPYGELEPFGREDTAQELTERSIKESDQMVDQVERAEVAEEKRSVFRALTRLRGAAITSYDGVARSQSNNIDEYNKVHKWRKAHPLHHLADEESDVAKWAFPDNADLLQTKTHALA